MSVGLAYPHPIWQYTLRDRQPDQELEEWLRELATEGFAVDLSTSLENEADDLF